MARKLVSIFVAAFMVLAMLTGCSGGNSSNTSAATETATSQATEAVTEAKTPVELNIWTTSGETDYEKQQKEEFMKLNPHIKINNIVREGDPGNDFLQGVAAGNAPDLVEASLANINKFAGAGIIVPIDEYFANWADSSKWDKKFVDQFKINGKLMALPTQGTMYYLAYNKKLFAEAGISAPPKTWDELVSVAKQLTKPEKQQWGYNMIIAEWSEWFFQYYVWQAGGDLTKKNDDGTLALTFTDPAVIEAAKLYRKLYVEKGIQSDITMKFEPLVKAFAAGKVGMMMFPTDWIGWVTSLGMKAEDIGLVIPPSGPAGKPYTFGGIGGGLVINAKASKEKQDAAWAYITFRSTTDYYGGKYKADAQKGAVGPMYNAITDFDISKYITIDPEWVKVTNELKPFTRGEEFYGKGVIGKYVDQAVQKITLSGTDPLKEFKSAEEKAKVDTDKFNESTKSGN